MDKGLVQAEVVTSGKANFLLRAVHVTRTRRAHKITAIVHCIFYRKHIANTLTEGNEQISHEN